MSTQQTDAIALLQVLRGVALANGAPIDGYCEAARMIGRTSADSDGRYMGQVCSRIDLACLYAGVPMLAYHLVRRVSGEVNPNAWANEQDFIEEIISTAASHVWSAAELDSVGKKLLLLKDRSARALWDEAEARGPEFIRFNLHRALRK